AREAGFQTGGCFCLGAGLAGRPLWSWTGSSSRNWLGWAYGRFDDPQDIAERLGHLALDFLDVVVGGPDVEAGTGLLALDVQCLNRHIGQDLVGGAPNEGRAFARGKTLKRFSLRIELNCDQCAASEVDVQNRAAPHAEDHQADRDHD